FVLFDIDHHACPGCNLHRAVAILGPPELALDFRAATGYVCGPVPIVAEPLDLPMKLPSRLRPVCLVMVALAFASAPMMAVETAGFASLKSQADLDALIAATADAALKQAMHDYSATILAAVEQRPHIEAVIRTIEGAPGKFEKINATPESLTKAAGGAIALFDTLKLVDLAMPNAGPHDQRKTDPFDAAFFEHLGHITALESLNIIATKANDDWIAPLGGLIHLKALRFTNNGKLTDAGLEHLAGLRQLETFAFVGTGMQGHAFAKFEGWTALKQSSFRGSSLDDEGLRLLCERFPNYESLSLAHARFTDAGAVHLAKLTKLKSLELGTHNATPKSLEAITRLPLENLQLGEGFDSPECLAYLKGMASLRRLTLTNAKALTDEDLQKVAGLAQLESLELDDVPLPDERVARLQMFSFLKSMRLVTRPKPYAMETQARIKAVLPGVTLKFD
ncbi:MAG: protein-coupled receptor, partial [Verrucomicrobiaceae bacterium]|nr:protein-coupled receptor [Verrucomicrobiaceae bacterium]